MTTPNARDLRGLPPALQRWFVEVSRAINDGVEGENAVATARETSDAIVNGDVSVSLFVEGVGDVSNAFAAQAANTDAIATTQGAGSTLAVTLSATALSAVASVQGEELTTLAVTATISGATGTPVISWTIESGTADITAPSGLTTQFRSTPPANTTEIATACITVTDDVATTERCVALSFRGARTGGIPFQRQTVEP